MTDPITSFAELDLPAPLLQALTDVGYETPSPIQAACIPLLLGGRDLMGLAQTGTGKTAAFAVPLLARLDLARKQPQALVLTPTRELAIQVAEAFQKYAHHLPGFHVLPVYGGQSMVVQLRALSRGAHVIVGTPGRVMDHLERKSLSLDNLSMLVLDEADEMLRMGFIDDVEWILEHTPATRQTALFSATMPEAILRVARKYLRDPQEVKIRAATTTVAAIRQRYWQARGADKLEALTRILEVEADFDAAIVFVRTKTATVDLAERLEARGYEAAALNGDMTQGLREQVIERLKSGSLDIVVATDVAARGIDVPRISHVINYDVPYDTEAYVHRIGRTGRAGRTGTAILFVAPREMRMLKAIEYATRQKIEAIALPTQSEVAGRRVAQFKQGVLETLEGEKLDFFYDVVRQMEEESGLSARQIAAALVFQAQRERPLQLEGAESEPVVPAVAAETGDRPRETGDRPQFHESRNRGLSPVSPVSPPVSAPRENRGEILERRRAFADGQLARYRIEVGRNQGASPKEIVGAIANEGGIEGKYIGQIHLFDDYSTVELPADLPADLLAVLRRTRVRQKPLEIRPLAPGEAEAKPRWQSERPPRPEGGYGDKRPAQRPGSPWENKPPRREGATWDKKPPRREGSPWEGRPPRRDDGASGSKPPYRKEGFGGKPPFRKEGFAGKPKK